jgi:hypothetical protein
MNRRDFTRVLGVGALGACSLGKGQVRLNAHAAGRYWEIGPQKTLYLPEPWWRERNHMAILDEEGRSPEQMFLGRDSRVPTTKVRL